MKNQKTFDKLLLIKNYAADVNDGRKINHKRGAIFKNNVNQKMCGEILLYC